MTNIQDSLPANAFDVSVKDFVARWKTPNSYAAIGFTSDARFLGASFLAAIRSELPELKDWQIVNYDGQPATDWTDRAALTDGQAKIWATTRGYGVNAYSKVELKGYALAEKGKYSSKPIEISASLNRPVTAIAKDIARRILPQLDSAKAEVNAKAKAERDAVEKITRKAEQLQKRYPNLRIKGDTQSNRVSIATKYGAGLNLDAYVYQSTIASAEPKWRLTSDRGAAIGADDIDSKAGRALLKLFNDN